VVDEGDVRGAGQDRELRGGQVLPRVQVIAERAADQTFPNFQGEAGERSL